MAIEFVGGTTQKHSGTLTSMSVSLTALTGGIASSVSAGDLIIVNTGWASTSNGDPGVTTAGYTEVADLYANGTNDANQSVAYLVAGSTPPTSLTVSAIGSSATTTVAIVSVFRGVDPTTPIDATTTTATGTGTSTADPAAITTVSTGACVVACALMGGVNAGSYSAPSGYALAATDFGTGGSTRNTGAGIAYLLNASVGSNNPGTMTCTAGGSGATWCAATLALRPLFTGQIKVWKGSSWVAEPVKYWNGSAWVTKPVKRWNGSAWVITPY